MTGFPWALGLTWMAWYAWRMPAGWKGFWIVACLVGLALPIIDFRMAPPHNGPGTIAFGLTYHQNMNGLKLIITIGIAGLYWWFTTGFPGVCTAGRAAICLTICSLTGCAVPEKRITMEKAMEAVDQGRVQGMTDKTDFTYSIPSVHKGPYSKVDRHNLVYENPDGTGGNATFFLGKSRKTGDWEAFLVMVWGKETGLKWKAIPVAPNM